MRFDRLEPRHSISEPVDSMAIDDLENARDALRRTHYTQLASINCKRRGDAIVLEGRVFSFHLKQLALHAVLRAVPNALLDDQIEVIRSSAK